MQEGRKGMRCDRGLRRRKTEARIQLQPCICQPFQSNGHKARPHRQAECYLDWPCLLYLLHPFLETSFLHSIEKVPQVLVALTARGRGGAGGAVLSQHMKIHRERAIGSTSLRCLPPTQSARATGSGFQRTDNFTNQS